MAKPQPKVRILQPIVDRNNGDLRGGGIRNFGPSYFPQVAEPTDLELQMMEEQTIAAAELGLDDPAELTGAGQIQGEAGASVQEATPIEEMPTPESLQPALTRSDAEPPKVHKRPPAKA